MQLDDVQVDVFVDLYEIDIHFHNNSMFTFKHIYYNVSWEDKEFYTVNWYLM